MSTEDDPEPGAGDRATSDSALRFRWDESVERAPLGWGRDAEPVAIDWTGRGAIDLLIGASGGPAGRTARIFRRIAAADGPSGWYDGGEPVEGLDGVRNLCAIPNGAPSRFDLVGIDLEGLVLLRNRGEADRPAFGPRESLWLPPNFGLGEGRIAQIVAVDWDGDGLVDLLVGFDDLTDYWPDGPAVPRTQQVGFNQRGGHPGYDVQGHWRGRPTSGRIFWLKNEGSAGQPRFTLQDDIVREAGPVDLGAHPAPLAVDWGGRGAWEILLDDDRGGLRLFRNFGGQRPPVLLEPRPLVSGGKPLALPDDRTVVIAADLDGDRKTGLVFGRADGRVFAIRPGNRRDEALAPEPIWQEPGPIWLGGGAVVSTADLDADGGLDLVVGDASGRLRWFRDSGDAGDHRYSLPIDLDVGGAPFRLDPGPDGMLEGPSARRLGHACPTLVDWSGHGRPDLLIGGAGGEVLFLRNNGTVDQPRFDVPLALRCAGGPLIVPPRVRPAAADWLGTGQLDLLALDLQGFLCVYPRTGPVEVASPKPLVDRLGRLIRLDGGFGLAGRCALWAGPWTGSGRTDLLVGLPRDARFIIPPLTGEVSGPIESLPSVLLLENQGNGEMVARPVFQAGGGPVLVGDDGCSPCGVEVPGREGLDLLVGSDDGTLHHFDRAALRW